MSAPSDLLPLVFVREHLRSWLDRAESGASGISRQLEQSLESTRGFQRSIALLREMLGGLINLNENPGAPSLDMARMFFSEYAMQIFHREHGVAVVSPGIAAHEVVRILLHHFEALIAILHGCVRNGRVTNLAEARAACSYYAALNVRSVVRMRCEIADVGRVESSGRCCLPC